MEKLQVESILASDLTGEELKILVERKWPEECYKKVTLINEGPPGEKER